MKALWFLVLVGCAHSSPVTASVPVEFRGSVRCPVGTSVVATVRDSIPLLVECR